MKKETIITFFSILPVLVAIGKPNSWSTADRYSFWDNLLCWQWIQIVILLWHISLKFHSSDFLCWIFRPISLELIKSFSFAPRPHHHPWAFLSFWFFCEPDSKAIPFQGKNQNYSLPNFLLPPHFNFWIHHLTMAPSNDTFQNKYFGRGQKTDWDRHSIFRKSFLSFFCRFGSWDCPHIWKLHVRWQAAGWKGCFFLVVWGSIALKWWFYPGSLICWRGAFLPGWAN